MLAISACFGLKILHDRNESCLFLSFIEGVISYFRCDQFSEYVIL